MSSFSELLKRSHLTKDSDFVELAQAAIEAHYLIPYPSATDKRPDSINRKFHGGLHVSSTALNIDLLIALYQKYKPNLLMNPDKTPITPQQLKLLHLAAIYHDSANRSEIIGEESMHAEKFQHDMTLLGYTKDELAPFISAIKEKHTDKKNETTVTEKSIYHKLLDDADRLDIIRVVRKDFKKNRLTIANELNDCKDFPKELDQIIENHHETIDLFYGVDLGKTHPLHKHCELSPNCFLAVQEAEKIMLKNHIVFECLKRGKQVNFNEIDISQLTILDFYNRKSSIKILNIIEKLAKTLEQQVEKKSTKDPVLEMLSHQGAYVRVLTPLGIDEELRILKTNEEILRKHDLLNTEKLKEYLTKQSEQKEVWTPPGFKWRPCSFVKSGIPIELFSGDLAVIIDPALQKGTLATYFYKRNVLSSTASAGKFVYEPQKGNRKNKATFQGIKEKIEEMERRRRGLELDPNLHYYGKEKLFWSEILGTYPAESVSGILVGDNKEAAKAALLLSSKLGTPFRPFYRRKSNTEIIPLSFSEVIQQSGILQESKLSETEELLNNLNSIFKNPMNTFSVSAPQTSLEKVPFSDKFPNRTFETELTTSFITCRLKGMDSHLVERISHLLNRILSNTLKLPGNDFQSIKMIKNDDTLSLKVVWFGDDDFVLNALNKYIIKVLSDLKSDLVQNISLVEAKLRTELSDIKITNLNTITCNKMPGIEGKPLQFEFIHPTKNDVQCTAFVNDMGKSVIQFNLPNEKQLEYETTLLPEIATRYYQLKIKELNQILQNEKVARYFTKLGIHINQVLLETNMEKSKLSFDLKLDEGKTIEESKEILTHLFKWKNAKKIAFQLVEDKHSSSSLTPNTMESSHTDHKKHYILTVPDIQNIDVAISSIAQFSDAPPIKFLGKSTSSTLQTTNSDLSHELPPPRRDKY